MQSKKDPLGTQCRVRVRGLGRGRVREARDRRTGCVLVLCLECKVKVVVGVVGVDAHVQRLSRVPRGKVVSCHVGESA